MKNYFWSNLPKGNCQKNHFPCKIFTFPLRDWGFFTFLRNGKWEFSCTAQRVGFHLSIRYICLGFLPPIRFFKLFGFPILSLIVVDDGCSRYLRLYSANTTGNIDTAEKLLKVTWQSTQKTEPIIHTHHMPISLWITISFYLLVHPIKVCL